MCGADLSHVDEEAEGTPESRERRGRKAGRDQETNGTQTNRLN
ncbi:MAG TPA: hypothetical protein PKK11_02065 [Methanothrix sp.]|nr:hypothetical protein [Methanothrix sp.]